jgi:uncharacterized membrane protein
MKHIARTFIIILILTGVAYAHGGDDHKKKKETEKVEQPATEQEEAHDHSAHEHGEMKKTKTVIGQASFEDFPSLHPMVVHFPIALLLLAAISALFGLFVFKEQLSWVTIFLTAGGLIGAYIAGSYVHPHTAGLSDHAEWLLTEHERFASYTNWTAIAALVLKLVSHFFLKRKFWSEALVALVLIGSAYCVSQAGHFGAQLTHIEGVGPQGNFLETGAHDHNHAH